MVKALLDSFKLLAKKPALLLPSIIVGLVTFGLFYLFEETMIEFMFSLVAEESLPPITSIMGLPAQFIALNLEKISLLAGMAVASLFLSLWLVFAYSHFVSAYAKSKGSVKESISYAVKRIPGILSLLVFALILLWVYGVIAWSALVLALEIEIIGAIAFIAVLFLGLYFFLGLMLTPVVMAAENLNLNKALRKAWAFSSKRLLGLFALLVLIFAINSVLERTSWFLADLLVNEWIGLAIGGLFFLIITSYQALALAVYYHSKAYGDSL